MSPNSTDISFSWERSARGVWERKVDECESFYWLYTKEGHGCYPITACASFRVKTSTANAVEKALKDAWVFLRHKHPTLGSHIEQDDQNGGGKRVYRPFQSDANVQHWLISAFKVVDCDKSALEWFNNDAPVFTVPTVYIINSKEDATHQTLFLRCPHDIADGVGILQLLNQLFTQAAQLYTQSLEYKYPLPDEDLGTRLSPCLRVAASIPNPLSEAQVQRFQHVLTRNGEIYNHPSLMSLPPISFPGTKPRLEAKRIAILIPKNLSTQILSNCKTVASGVSLTHTFVSALAMALAEFQPRREEAYTARYVDRPMLNLRPFCQEPYKTPDHAGATYHAVCAQALAIDVEVPGLADDKDVGLIAFSEFATKVRDFYNQHKPTLLEDIDEQVLFAPLTFQSLTPPPGADPWRVSDPPFCPVSLSSIGNLASIVSPSNEIFEFSHVWVASQSIAAGVAVFLGSWDGKIELSSVFNSQFHSEEYIQKFLECILKHVYRGLDIHEK
ncbi:hypothetical protein FBEOM_1486 [Fusarium beomiforme]|uniref:Uncharacterized protein n=1 Tax=Fusarium beomiforme TaxID=44412 RepID=A0A9P5ATU2_9HYPO|nr:hypothetical protein FBEOM_1486 [Fusarium beomiforme]